MRRDQADRPSPVLPLPAASSCWISISTMLTGDLVEEEVELSLAELCNACKLTEAQIVELVDQGVIDPMGHEPDNWRFQGISLRRVRLTRNLQRDLGVNAPGAALALDLLEELEQLRARLRRFEQ